MGKLKQSKYPIDSVKLLASSAKIGSKVAERMCRENSKIRFPKAIPLIRKMIEQDLCPEAFVETKCQDYVGSDSKQIYADVYGVKNAQGIWYVKLYIEGGEMVVVSCHEPEYPLLRADGKTLRPRGK